MNKNRYEKLKKLGSGSFGEAWLVRSSQSHRQYVIKELKMSPNMTKEECDRVNNEVSIIRSCCHVNIIKYKEFFMTCQDQFSSVISIVMEFADSGDLNQRIIQQKERERTHFPETQVRSWFIQICFGLQYLHKKSILHRDIKTQNIFICSNKLLKLGDFGISKTLSHENDFATTGIGTPQYLSPEICRQQPYDFKSDIWCLGCVLYEMCALLPAFPGRDFERLINSIVNAKYAPIPGFYSQSIAELIKILLRPEPSRRPSVVQLLGSTVLKDDVFAYMDFIKNMTSSQDGASGSSGSGSYAGGQDFRKDSASSLNSSGGPQSFV